MRNQKYKNIIILLLSILTYTSTTISFAAQADTPAQDQESIYLYSYKLGECVGNAKYCFAAARHHLAAYSTSTPGQWKSAGDSYVLQLKKKNDLAAKNITVSDDAIKTLHALKNTTNTLLFGDLEPTEINMDIFLLGESLALLAYRVRICQKVPANPEEMYIINQIAILNNFSQKTKKIIKAYKITEIAARWSLGGAINPLLNELSKSLLSINIYQCQVMMNTLKDKLARGEVRFTTPHRTNRQAETANTAGNGTCISLSVLIFIVGVVALLPSN